MTGTSHNDSDNLVSGTEYFYVVRAVDQANSAEDTNTVEHSGTPTGPGGGSTVFASTDTPIAIPDNNATGITSVLTVAGSGVISDIMVSVDITHTYIGDLIVELTSPGSTPVRLHNRSGGTTNNLVTTYDVPTTPDGPGVMSDFDTENANGDWELWVSDNAGIDTGSLNEWSLEITVDNPCTTGTGCTQPVFGGVQSVTDLDDCGDTGVRISWSAPSNWNDSEGRATSWSTAA